MGQSALRPLDEALHEMLTTLPALTDTLTLPIEQALGRVLAVPIISPMDVPPFDNSAMDGYALRSADLVAGDSLLLQGRALAGHPLGCEGAYGSVCEAGHCVRIMTGAALPEGADCVIMQEEAQADGNRITFTTKPATGQHVRRRGEDIARGAEVLAAGTRLTPRELPLLASLGIARVQVLRPLKVALLSTGDELKPVGTPLAHGEIYDSNRYGVRAMLERLQVEILDLGIIPDDPEQLRAAFLRARREADALITSGGVSVGEADYTKQLLEELGKIGFWKLAIKPGKPFAFGRLEQTWFFGLPGNPVSAMVTFDQLVRPALARLAGETVRPPLRLTATAAEGLKKAPGRLDFQRGILESTPTGLVVRSTGSQDSGVFSSLSRANCYIVLERERGQVAAGESVTVEPFGSLLQ
ncbi:molybdopterin molybdotransferase MoeA [Aeromonas schubertii]|uniref:molybdopterin molybdotransferase MoeA n=1 Tax=Aeromonas schubertii TaxID=652 RepID=UPI001CC3DEA2|nr:molybdopterin molybdotransferase MoeA [Aeromonas schubertii]MBZ6074287.1 molybdopterin molybdotransferase MoeA [Aeromonas schubertii]